MTTGDPHSAPRLSGEVATALELAKTCVPFARSAEGEADRWLRVLRRLERTGDALQELGVADCPLESPAEALGGYDAHRGGSSVSAVAQRAVTYTQARGGRVVGTIDLLFAVLAVYGKDFSKALYRRGVTREQLLDHLAMQAAERRTEHARE